MKTLIKLLIAALVLHACWRGGTVFYRYYNFKDGAHNAALFGAQKSEDELHGILMQLAGENNVPIKPENLKIRKVPNHTYIDTFYTERIEVVPTFFYPWEFKVNLDVFVIS